MNLAFRAKLTNILTAVATVIGILQTTLTSPPFTAAVILIGGVVFTYLMLLVTTWKQYVSTDITNTAAHITIGVAIAATLTGALVFLDVFHVSPANAQWIRWSVSIAVLILNVLSKTIFPSTLQQAKMKDLKLQH